MGKDAGAGWVCWGVTEPAMVAVQETVSTPVIDHMAATL